MRANAVARLLGATILRSPADVRGTTARLPAAAMLAAIALLPGTLAAQSRAEPEPGFRAGAIFVDFGLTATGRAGGGVDYFTKDRFEQRNRYVAATSSSTNARLLAFYSLELRPAARVGMSQMRLGFEYGFFSWLGIGYSIESVSLRVKDVPLTTNLRLAPWLLDAGGWSSAFAGPSGVDTANALVTPVRLGRVTSANFELTAHLPAGRIDPYLRLALGISTFQSSTGHYALALGSRYHATRALYFYLEVAADLYDINYGGGGGGGDSSGDSGGGESGTIRSGPVGGPRNRSGRTLASGIETRLFSARVSRISLVTLRVGVGIAY